MRENGKELAKDSSGTKECVKIQAIDKKNFKNVSTFEGRQQKHKTSIKAGKGDIFNISQEKAGSQAETGIVERP